MDIMATVTENETNLCDAFDEALPFLGIDPSYEEETFFME